MDGDKLKPEFADRGVIARRAACSPRSSIRTSTWKTRSSAATPTTRSRCAARSAWPTTSTTRSRRSARVRRCRATQPIPPNVVGYDPDFKGGARYDVAGAKALLDKFGYVDRDGDGWRDLPDGKPLKLTLASDPSAIDRQFDELWKKSMDAVGIRIEFTKQKFPDR